jgi:hypothetical protein
LSFDREATVGKWIIKRKVTPNHPLSKEDEKKTLKSKLFEDMLKRLLIM